MGRVAVIGSRSMVGSRFCELTKLPIVKGDLSGDNPIDITDSTSTTNFFERNDFDCCILFSAFTDVDSAETQRGDKNGNVWKINVEGAQNIVDSCKKYRKELIFISTDYVFDGLNGPYGEDAVESSDTSKISWYGLTKREAEHICKGNLIIRITYPYRGPFADKLDFARQILQKVDEGNLYPMFSDQITTPTFVDDMAPAIELLISKESLGVFHVASPEATSPYEYAKFLLQTFGRDEAVVKKGSLASVLADKSSTPRPLLGGLKVDKLISLGFKPTSYKDGIKEIFRQSKEAN